MKLLPVFNALALRANPNERLYFTEAEFEVLQEFNMIVDLEAGGLLMAPSHEDNGITLLQYVNGVYQFAAELEGWEFVFSSEATALHGKQLINFNATNYHKDWLFTPYEIPADIRIVDARPLKLFESEFKKYLIHSSKQFLIINKHATKMRLRQLNKVNESVDFGYFKKWLLKPYLKRLIRSFDG